jgi:membrane-bound lytic murein transglycosylase MltF
MARAAFTSPVLSDVREIVVTDDDVPDLESAEALSGKEFVTRRSTSYYESLTKLNERLAAMGRPPMTITFVPDTLESEDLMEMTVAGLLPAVVVDDWVAGLWVQIIKGLKLHPKAVLREGGEIAWAVRPDNPKLLATLNRMIAEIDGNALKWASRTKIYLAKLKQSHSATKGVDMQRFRDTLEIFRTYAGQYGFDTLLLLAQGYQESRLDQRAHSRVGAIGLMQVMPKTGRYLGVGDIRQAPPNVHAGAKYMAQQMDNVERVARTGSLRPQHLQILRRLHIDRTSGRRESCARHNEHAACSPRPPPHRHPQRLNEAARTARPCISGSHGVLESVIRRRSLLLQTPDRLDIQFPSRLSNSVPLDFDMRQPRNSTLARYGGICVRR